MLGFTYTLILIHHQLHKLTTGFSFLPEIRRNRHKNWHYSRYNCTKLNVNVSTLTIEY